MIDATKTPPITMVALTDIKVSERQREDVGDVRELADSINKIGLLNPIIIEDDYTLRAGMRRYLAHAFLGRTHIPARFWGTLDPIEQQTVELEENLRRKSLTWDEEIKAKTRLHELMQIKHPQPIPTAPTHKVGQPSKSWGLKDTAELLGESVAKVSQDITLARAMEILPDLKDAGSKTQAMRLFRKRLELAALTELRIREATTPNSAPLGQVIEGDCNQFLPGIPEQSIDLIITDPPWGIELSTNAREWVRAHTEFQDDAKHAMEITDLALTQCARALKDGGHLYLFCAWHMFTHWAAVLTGLGFWVRPIPLVWVKNNVTAGQPYWKFMCKTECILFAHKGAGGRVLNTPASDVLLYDIPRNRIHPTEKPVDLLRYLISLSSLEGDLILDPFAGSGSTIKAALLMKRRGIGYEINPDTAAAARIQIFAPADSDGTEPTS